MPPQLTTSALSASLMAHAVAEFEKQEKSKRAASALRISQNMQIRVTPPQSPARPVTNDDSDSDDTRGWPQQTGAAKSIAQPAAAAAPVAHVEIQVEPESHSPLAESATIPAPKKAKRGGRVKGSKNKKTLARLAHDPALHAAANEARRAEQKRAYYQRNKATKHQWLNGKSCVHIGQSCGGLKLCVSFAKFAPTQMDVHQTAASHADFQDNAEGREQADTFLRRGIVLFNVPHLQYRRFDSVLDMRFSHNTSQILRLPAAQFVRLVNASLEWRETSVAEQQFGFVRRLWCRAFPDDWTPIEHFLYARMPRDPTERLCFPKDGDDTNFMPDNLVAYMPEDECVLRCAPWFWPISRVNSNDDDSSRTYRVRAFHDNKEQKIHRRFGESVLPQEMRRRFCQLVEMCVKKKQWGRESKEKLLHRNKKRTQPDVAHDADPEPEAAQEPEPEPEAAQEPDPEPEAAQEPEPEAAQEPEAPTADESEEQKKAERKRLRIEAKLHRKRRKQAQD